jgi:hypothetical protein
MTSIAEVIGWKFNSQPGMETRDGVITEFPGGIPSQADQDAWTAEYEIYKAAMDEITRLESFISERRKREALLGNAEAIAFIQGVEDDIAIERAKL